MIYLMNSFSAQMLDLDKQTKVEFTPMSIEQVKSLLEKNIFLSVIGHQDTANILSNMLNKKIEFNRKFIKLTEKDIYILCQYNGGRLPEGATELPKGASFKFVSVSLKEI